MEKENNNNTKTQIKEIIMIKIETQTKSGTNVTIFLDEHNCPVCEVSHPAIRGIHRGGWGKIDGKSGFLIRRAKIKGKYIPALIEISLESYEPIRKALEASRAAEKAAEKIRADERKAKAISECPSGYQIATTLWTNGDLMSGEYKTEDGTKVIGPDMLKNHHGYVFVEKEFVEKEKDEAIAKETKRIENETKEANRVCGVFKKAKQEKQRQILKTFSASCNNSSLECNLDIITVWAMPDGNTSEERMHTY